MSKPDVNKMMVEAALTKVLKDLKTDPEASLRKWLDRKDRAKGDAQQVLLMQMKRMLKDPGSAYHTLIKRVVNNVKSETLKTFGMNLGYNGFTAGTKTIRSQELIYDVHIPWAVSFDMDGSVTASDANSIIGQAKALGIYCYHLHCRTERSVYDLPSLFARQKDCAFIVYVRPEAVGERLMEQYGRHGNVLIAVACHEHDADEKFAMLKKAGFLYAAHYEYDAANVQPVFSGRYVDYAAKVGAAFALVWPRAGTDTALQKQVYEYLNFKRQEQREPVLAVEVLRDTLYLDQLLSKEAAFLCFNDRGRRVNLETGAEEGKKNLWEQSFLQILEAL